MSVRKNVSISLSPELHAVVERLLVSGRYSNFSEVVRAGLRLLDEREQDFQTHQQGTQFAQQPGTTGKVHK